VTQDYPDFEVILVDNGSQDASLELVRANFKQVSIIANPSNLGVAAGFNKGMLSSLSDYVIALNQDTEVSPGWLSELVKAVKEDGQAGAATSKILLAQARGLINACGNSVHFTGLAFCRGLGSPADRFPSPAGVAALSGCSFIIKREILEKLGGFDEDFFSYVEDIDLSWRIRLLGYKIAYVPSSVVYHKYATFTTSRKFYYLERNRLVMLTKNYSLATLVRVFPALLLSELVAWGFAVLMGKGYYFAKARAYFEFIASLRKTLLKRNTVQSQRVVSDGALLDEMLQDLPLTMYRGLVGNAKIYNYVAAGFNHVYRAIYRRALVTG
jgi:GT2 family glycosyltransferase